MRHILLAGLVLALSACDTPSYKQQAATACGGISNAHSRQVCVANYLTQAQLQNHQDWEDAGEMLYNGSRRRTSCMNIGGIVTCQ